MPARSQGITAAVRAAVGEDVTALDPALQCRLALRWLESLVRAGHLDRSVPGSLVKLRELSGEVGAAPRVDPSQLACSEALLIEVSVQHSYLHCRGFSSVSLARCCRTTGPSAGLKVV